MALIETQLEHWRTQLERWHIPFGGIDRRDWGAFILLDTEAALHSGQLFAAPPELNEGEAYAEAKLLIINDVLSFQYHRKRREVWRVLAGEVAVTYELEPCAEDHATASLCCVLLRPGDELGIPRWAIHWPTPRKRTGVAIAEVWIHHPDDPTEEDDIVRVFDPWGRKEAGRE